MKLNIKKELLIKAISIAEKNVGKNLTLPVLGNILIKAEKNKLKIISTDLELAVIIEMPAKIEKEGSIVVNPKTINGFLNNSPEGSFSLKTQKNILSIEQKNYRTSIKGFNEKDFPLLPKVDKKNFFTIPSGVITKGLNQVINSTSISDLKPELSGILFDIKKTEFKLVSTDSFRLSEKTIIREKSESVHNESFILTTKTVQEIIKNYQDLNNILFFYVEKNQVTIQNEDNQKLNIQIISKIIESDYPDYTQIIPKEYITKIILSRKDFIQQIKGASLFASRINDIELNFKLNRLNIHTQNQDVGEFDSFIETATKGKEQQLKFNYQYLLDGLNNLEGDEVLFKVSKTDGPSVLESTKYKDYFYIIMPVRK